MRGFSLGIECIVKGLMWIHRKSGINGILGECDTFSVK